MLISHIRGLLACKETDTEADMAEAVAGVAEAAVSRTQARAFGRNDTVVLQTKD